MKVFVTGAAGYIGSVVTERLLDEGRQVVAFDNFDTGNRQALDPRAELIEGDLRDLEAVTRALKVAKPDAVVHLAARSLVGESVENPALYFEVNVGGGLNLLHAMRESGVNRIVFSSTASVYGEPEYAPIDEDHPKRPVNPYGESKIMFERILGWCGQAHGLKHVSLRYFNACGASSRFGEARKCETHILPILFQAALGRRKSFSLFGTDYETPDGTCVRDYVHVIDIANAHIAALEHIDEVKSRAFNIGSGAGYSNLEIIEAVRRVTGVNFAVESAPRRAGDPARLTASNELIQRELGWKPQFTSIEPMARSAWDFAQRHPNGYSN
ncbi:MAG: UDP-glucose 4-epimerase GalE [Armatimonadetes bacterium]|nr:UDP-glucose 4-epimerase GalE [Armatimonadota bacterium]